MFTQNRWTALSGGILIALSLTACNGSSDSTVTSTPTVSSTPTATYTVGGSITGLAAGQSVTLLDNGGDGYVATANGTFTFASSLATGATYAVTVGTQPSGQKCTVTNGSGTMGSANVSNVSVSCLSLGFTSMYSFGSGNDGAFPYAGLIRGAGGNFYGTTPHGGIYNRGTVFKIDTSGNETVLYSFRNNGSDGQNPQAGLIMDASGNLYGTTVSGGANNAGTVFKIDTSGNETVLHSFGSGNDGANPYAGLVQGTGGNLYGTTFQGGANNYGTVFKIDTSGNETVLYSFQNSSSDGQNPKEAGLIMDASGNLYGTTVNGGASGSGTVFKIDTSGNETVLYSFQNNGSDGMEPHAGLIMDASGNLYGTTGYGGAYGYGTVFKLTPDAVLAGYYIESVLYSFGSGNDGKVPYTGLIQDASGNLYGTTVDGGNGYGTVFKIDTSGNETVLYSFAASSDGQGPQGDLAMDASGNLYGTTIQGGTNGYGTVFRYVFP